jgi:hypothetical protein
MARFRRTGVSHRVLARAFGYSKSAFHRKFAGPVDAIVSQMGRDEAENDKLLSAWSSQMVQVLFEQTVPRRPALPRESEGARLMAWPERVRAADERAAWLTPKRLARLTSTSPARLHPRPGRMLDRRANLELALKRSLIVERHAKIAQFEKDLSRT